MRPLQSVVTGVKNERLRMVNYLFAAFSEVMEILRDNRIDEIREDVVRLYGIISGNTFIQSQLSKIDTKIIDEYRPEMVAFVRGRVVFIVNSMIQAIANSNMINGVMSRGNGLSSIEGITVSYNSMSMQDLRLAEFDITRSNEGIIKNKDSIKDLIPNTDKNAGLSEANEPNVVETLLNLVLSAKRLISMSSSSTRKVSKVKRRDQINNDTDAINKLMIIGKLIGDTGRALMTVKVGDHHGYDGNRNEFCHELVYDDFNRLSNIGALTIPGILCCYRNEMLMKLAVVSDRSELGFTERRFLLNMLALSKLTSSIY